MREFTRLCPPMCESGTWLTPRWRPHPVDVGTRPARFKFNLLIGFSLWCFSLETYPMGTLDEKTEQNGRSGKDEFERRRSCDALLGFQDAGSSQNNPHGRNSDDQNAADFEEDYKARLHEELLGRDNEGHLRQNANIFTLSFRDPKLEKEFRKTKDSVSVVSMSGLPIIVLFCTVAYFLVISGSVISVACLPLGLILLTGIVVLCIAPLGVKSGPPFLSRICNKIQEKPGLRLMVVIVMVSIWAAIHIVSSLYNNHWSEDDFDEPPSDMNDTEEYLFLQNFQKEILTDEMTHNFPQYLSYFCVLQLLGITVLTHLPHVFKMIITSLIAVLQGCINTLIVNKSLDDYDLRTYRSNDADVPHSIYLSVIVAAVTFAVIVINRQLEVISRRLFLWQKAVEEQREKVADMRVKNEALVYNILPPHVAKHFLGQRKNDEELYSKSYEAVGVLFAAMPNFSDFYTEDTVNNQGLECLRFLNEVISDYDALLEQPRFKDIIKIKTIGSTYMAASGLTDDNYKPNAPIKEKWAHLAQLTEFALTLKDTLAYINKESFNNFVLRMGINQGPITAGVIGARKPHYDMWGNTVNVASRMESTGKAGCIQVVEETAHILEEFNYVFEQRGMVAVKGKGNLMTYYLLGRASELNKVPNSTVARIENASAPTTSAS